MQGLSHGQAIKLFKEVKFDYETFLKGSLINKTQVRGPMSLYLARRGHEMRGAVQERGFR